MRVRTCVCVYVHSNQLFALRKTKCVTLTVEDEVNFPAPNCDRVFQIRQRLVAFIGHVQAQFDPVNMLTFFPLNLYVENAHLFARALNHENALTIWVHVLNDWSRADQHCANFYQSSLAATATAANTATSRQFAPSGSKQLNGVEGGGVGDVFNYGQCCSDVYAVLLRVCLQPCDPNRILHCRHIPDSLANRICIDPADSSHVIGQFQPKLSHALHVLERHWPRVDPVEAMRMLPADDIRLADIGRFLVANLELQQRQLTRMVFLRHVYAADRHKSTRNRVHASEQRFEVPALAKCRECGKALRDCAIARYPNGDLVHYGCCKDLQQT